MPPELLDKIHASVSLSPDEQSKFAEHPSVGRKLLENIPRLELVAEMIAHQQNVPPIAATTGEPSRWNPVILGSQMLKVANRYDLLLSRGISPDQAIAQLKSQPELYHPRIVGLLDARPQQAAGLGIRTVRTSDVQAGMIVAQDVCAKNGALLLSNGVEVTQSAVKLLHYWAERGDIPQMLVMMVPSNLLAQAA